MTPIQEIVVHTDKGARITIHIIKASGQSSFTSEFLIFDPALDPEGSTLSKVGGTFKTAKESFTAGFTDVVQLCGKGKHKITHIDNPCNCEFLLAQVQEEIANKQGITVAVTVNGK